MTHPIPVGKLEEIIRDSTNRFFDDPEHREDMRVTLRVTLDFCGFLLRHESEPDAADTSYLMGTVQSGIDSFVAVGHACRSFAGLEESWVADQKLPLGFPEIKSAFLTYFSELTDANSSPVDRLGSLLRLVRIQLGFVAWYFPWGERSS